jgi:hypothetical protein
MVRVAICLIALLTVSCRPLPLPQAASTYCASVVGDTELFLAVYPPRQGIAPNSVVELQLPDGWSTSARRCIPFSAVFRGDGGDIVVNEAMLAAVRITRNESGGVTLGAASLNLLLGRLAAGVTAETQVDVSFDEVRQVQSKSPLEIIVDDSTGQTLDERIYPFVLYKGKRGPQRAKRNSLFLLRVENVYQAYRARYTLEFHGDGDLRAEVERVAQQLSVSTGLQWSAKENAVFADRSFTPPLAIGVEGTLHEVSSRDKRLLQFQRYPIVKP